MHTLTPLIIVALIALVQATFQLSISMLTLLSSHAIGRKKSQRQLRKLTSSFTAGVFFMTLLLLSLSALILAPLFDRNTNTLLLWTTFCGMTLGLGLSVWVFYYRKEAGTKLWVPRPMVRYLTERTKKTSHTAEAFGLGISSVVGELLFIFVPILIAAAFIVQLQPLQQLVGALLYAVTATSSLIFVNCSLLAGGSISRIQKWRETNKSFLQFAAGSGLVVLGFYLYVDQVVSTSAVAAAGGF